MIHFEWQTDDSLIGSNETGEILTEIRLSDIPVLHWEDEENPKLISLSVGETAGCVNRDELPEQLIEYFKTHNISDYDLKHLWTWICYENFTAWFDSSAFADLPQFEFAPKKEEDQYKMPGAEKVSLGNFQIGEKGYEVYVWKNDVGLIPHLHICDMETNGEKLEVAVQLNEPAYYFHDWAYDILNDEECEELWKFLGGRKDRALLRFRSKYIEAINIWNDGNTRYRTSFGGSGNCIGMPDYRKMIDRYNEHPRDVLSQIPDNIDSDITVFITSSGILKRKAAREIYNNFKDTHILEDIVMPICTEEVWNWVEEEDNYFYHHYKGNLDEAYRKLNQSLKSMGQWYDKSKVKDEEMRKVIDKLINEQDEDYLHLGDINGRNVIILDDGETEDQTPKNAEAVLNMAYSPKFITIISVKKEV